MKRAVAAAVAVAHLTACASGPHVYADDGSPEGIPKSARAHCRSYAAEMVGGEDQRLHESILQCLDGILRRDCAEEMAREAERLNRKGQDEAPFWFRFPGAWEPDEVAEQAEELKEAACEGAKAAAVAAALHLAGKIRSRYGGRIPWSSFGAPRPGTGMCLEGCK